MEQGTSPTYSTVTAAPQPWRAETQQENCWGRTSWGITRKTTTWPCSAEQLLILLLHP